MLDARQGKTLSDKLKSKTNYAIEYYDAGVIVFTSIQNAVIKTDTGFHVFYCVVNIPNQVTDGAGMFTIASSLSGVLSLIQPATGKTYPINITKGSAKAWGTIPACNNCFLMGVLHE